jgi:hypothetical protein
MGALLQVCQPGYDVNNCPDWAYLFNSDWPSLAQCVEFKVPTAGATFPIVLTHNLGFPPLAIVYNHFATAGGQSYGRGFPALGVTATTISVGLVTGDYIVVRLYNVDISKEATYPLPQSAQAKLPYNSNFGIKYAKDNKLITSNDLNDFVIHSRAQSPAVLQVATEKGKFFTNTNPGSQYAGPWIVYPLQTSYIPWVLMASLDSTSPVTYGYQSINAVEYINNKMVYPLIGAAGGSLIVLRDPLFYPNIVRVVY